MPASPDGFIFLLPLSIVWITQPVKTILPELLNFDHRKLTSKNFWYSTDDIISEKDIRSRRQRQTQRQRKKVKGKESGSDDHDRDRDPELELEPGPDGDGEGQ